MAKKATRKAPKKSQPSYKSKRQSSPLRPGTTEPQSSSTALSPRAKHDAGNGSPFTFLQRFGEEMNRLFEDYGFGRAGLAPTLEIGLDKLRAMAAPRWSPQVEIFERENKVVIRADLPGVTKDNVEVDIANDAVVIRGERKSEREENESGYYRSERSYGSFYRRIPLPQGSSAGKATTNFRNGVLKIELSATTGVERKRRQLKIKGETASEEQPRSKAKAASQR